MSARTVDALPQSDGSLEGASWWLDIHEALPCISLLERDGWIVARNAVARQIIGTGLGERVPVAEVLGKEYCCPGQDREQFQARLTRSDRSTVHVNGVIQKLAHGGIAYGSILLLENENELPGSAEVSGPVLKDLLDAAPEATAITRNGRVLHVNRRFVQLFGYTLAECVGKLMTALVVPDGLLHEAEMMLHVLKDNEKSTLQTTRRTHSGEEIDVSVVLSRVRLGDDSAGLLITYQDIRQQKRQEARLQHNALHDVVTGLANRALFLNRVQLTMARLRRRPDRNFAVLFLDLDGFKKINDKLGHAAGDALLLHVRDRLLSCLRPQDTVARFGGDEFALLLDESGSTEQAERVALRVQSEIQTPFQFDGVSLRVSASIGIVMGTIAYGTADEMTHDADCAMYQAKTGGMARHVLFQQPAVSHGDASTTVPIEVNASICA